MATFEYTMSGGVVVGGTSNSGISTPISVDLPLSWNVRATVIVDLQIGWNTGRSVYYYYRVEGICLPYGCPPVNDQSASEQACKFSFIKNVIADSVCDVCAQLKATGFIRTIKSIKKFSRPARKVDRDALKASGTSQDCDYLIDTAFCQCIECALFCDYQGAQVNPPVTTGSNNQIVFEEGYTYHYAEDYVFLYKEANTSGDCLISLQFGDVDSAYYEVWTYPCPSISLSSSSSMSLMSSSTSSNYMISTAGRINISGEAIVSWNPNSIDLVASTGFIQTACDCSNLATKIYMIQNFNQANKFSDFLYRNSFTYDENQPIYYDANNQSWISNLNFTGISGDGITTEIWTVVLEWACTTQIGGQDLGAPYWKFGAHFNVRNVQNNTTTNTRVLMTFSRLGPCINGDIAFSIVLNTSTGQGTSSPRNLVDNVLVIDNIGLFKSAVWVKNPFLKVKISDFQLPVSPTPITFGFYAPTNEIVRKT